MLCWRNIISWRNIHSYCVALPGSNLFAGRGQWASGARLAPYVRWLPSIVGEGESFGWLATCTWGCKGDWHEWVRLKSTGSAAPGHAMAVTSSGLGRKVRWGTLGSGTILAAMELKVTLDRRTTNVIPPHKDGWVVAPHPTRQVLGQGASAD